MYYIINIYLIIYGYSRMNISTFSINGDGATRRICVVNGQAFYQSSGTSSNMARVWLPFRGVTDESFAHVLGMIQKPLVTHKRRAKIGDYFPAEVAAAIKEYGNHPKDWGRFQNMSCLIISCMLSPEAIPAPIKEAVLKYIEPNTLPTPTFHDSPEPAIELNDQTVDIINSKLIELGAHARPKVEDVDPYFSLEEMGYDSENFDPNKFVDTLQTDNVTQRFKHILAKERPGSLSTFSSDSDKTDRETDSETDSDSPRSS